MPNIVVPVPEGATCEEVEDAVICKHCFSPEYRRCGMPATKAVWHQKDRRAYYMCAGCAYHNINNRGGLDVTQ